MYHHVTVAPTSLERELLACYADLNEHGHIEDAILHLAVSRVRERLETDRVLAERWQKHLTLMADRAAQWDQAHSRGFTPATYGGSITCQITGSRGGRLEEPHQS